MNASDVFRTRELFVFFRLQLVSEGGKQEAILLNFIWKSISSSACRELRIQTHTHTHTHREILGNTHTRTETDTQTSWETENKTSEQNNKTESQAEELLQKAKLFCNSSTFSSRISNLDWLSRDSNFSFKIRNQHAPSRYNITIHLQDTISPCTFVDNQSTTPVILGLRFSSFSSGPTRQARSDHKMLANVFSVSFDNNTRVLFWSVAEEEKKTTKRWWREGRSGGGMTVKSGMRSGVYRQTRGKSDLG